MAARLIVQSPGQPDQEVSLGGGASIGRASNNSICVQAAGVSRYHVTIEQRRDGFWVSDLGSRNGTLLNRIQLTAEKKLADGDTMMLGDDVSVVFRVEPAQPDSSASTREGRAESPPDSSTDGTGKSDSKAGKGAGVATGLLTGLAIVGVVGLILVIAYLFSSRSSARSDRAAKPAVTQNGGSPAGSGPVAARAESRSNADFSPASSAASDQPDSGQVPPAAGSTPAADAALIETMHMAEVLAVQISGHRWHRFDGRFVEQIRRVTPEYRFEFIDDARLYSRDIKAAFNGKGLDPVLGLVLAMSRTRMKKSAEGLWGLPGAFVRDAGYLKPDEDGSVLAEPARSSEIAATYLKQLQDQFGGRESFIYAVACYGDRIEMASAMRQKLDSVDPGWSARADFWRMVEANVVPPEAAARVVRFFAAGIVCENPDKFGLRGDRLDSLLIN